MAEILNRGNEIRGTWRGTIVANGTTPVAFTDAYITPKAFIHFTIKTVGGTPAPMVIQTITPGAGNQAGTITVASSAGNTSTYNVHMIG